MSDYSDSPAGSLGSIASLALLHGCIILILLIVGTMMGWIARLDGTLVAWMSDLMGEDFAHSMPTALLRFMTVLIAFVLPALLLACRYAWQRLTVWMASLAVLALWAPVLSLAAHRPEISAAWIAAACSGLLVTLHLYWMARKEAQAS